MNSITVQLPEERIQKLRERAGQMGLSIEDLVCIGIDEILSQPDDPFAEGRTQPAANNSELYRRLL